MLNKFKKIACVLCSVFLILFATVPASAATTEPIEEIQSLSESSLTFDEVVARWGIDYDKELYKYYVLCKVNDSDSYYLALSSVAQGYFVSSNFLSSFNGNGSTAYVQTFNINGSLSYNYRPLDSLRSLVDLSKSTIIDSNYDVCDRYTGEVFFTEPTLLQHLLNKVPQGVGNKLKSDLVILMVCGIGCLALLIGLPLLPKVLAKFLH